MPNVTIKVCYSVSLQDNVIDQSESAIPLNNVQYMSINAICNRSQTLTLDLHYYYYYYYYSSGNMQFLSDFM